MREITERLFSMKDEEYANFHRRLIPTVRPEAVIGVRTPVLRKLAKEISGWDSCQTFLTELPHTYYEENQLHGFILSEIKDFDACIAQLETFLPYMDNWATCDQTSPKVFKKEKKRLLPYISKWLASGDTYTVRFGIGMLMQHFLDEDFEPKYLDWVSAIHSEEYYVNMEIAWYMATALTKQWDTTIGYIEQGKLEKWVHNKTIQKARESYRVPKDRKEYLKSLKKTD